jgi:hypothetical protein
MNTSSSTTDAVATCAVASHAIVEARLSGIAAIRDQPSPIPDLPLPPRFLRHCDEQTVVGMRAVLEAIAGYPGPRPSFERFGVIASSCAAGRIASAQTLAQLDTRGSAAVSPHIVPQCSLHAMASAVSVSFGMHGPNIGTSGGAHALSEGLFTAFTLLAPSTAASNAGCEGLWLIASEWDEEPLLDTAGKTLNDPLCRALALAITPSEHHASGQPAAGNTLLTLHLERGRDDRMESDRSQPADAIAAFARALAMCVAGGALQSWVHPFPWGAEVRVVARDSSAVFRREAA